MEDFPPNSKKFKAGQRAAEDRNVKRVTSAKAVRRRTPFGKQFSNVFFGGNAKDAFSYTFANVVIPNMQEMFLDAVNSWMQRKVYGERTARRPRATGPLTGMHVGRVDYSTRSSLVPDDRPPMPTRMLSRTARERHAFSDIVISSRQEAEEVLDRLYDLVSQHGNAQVADLYALTGLESTHTDFKWGWTDLRGARVGRVRGGGYLLELPEAEQL